MCVRARARTVVRAEAPCGTIYIRDTFTRTPCSRLSRTGDIAANRWRLAVSPRSQISNGAFTVSTNKRQRVIWRARNFDTSRTRARTFQHHVFRFARKTRVGEHFAHFGTRFDSGPTRRKDLELQVETFMTKCISINFVLAVYLDFRRGGLDVYFVPRIASVQAVQRSHHLFPFPVLFIPLESRPRRPTTAEKYSRSMINISIRASRSTILSCCFLCQKNRPRFGLALCNFFHIASILLYSLFSFSPPNFFVFVFLVAVAIIPARSFR